MKKAKFFQMLVNANYETLRQNRVGERVMQRNK